jgi:UDP-2,3-diacylglucosamine hydrolase
MPARKKQFLSQPLARRKEEIEELRRRSESEKKLKTPEIMDVNVEAVETVLREHDYPRLIHGHTHRPARHEHLVDGRTCERWVLSDWYRTGSYLRCDERGCASVQLP